MFRRAGANDSLLKPFTRASLEACLGKWLHQKTDESEHLAEPAAEIVLLNPGPINEIRSLPSSAETDLANEIAQLFFDQTPALIKKISVAISEDDCESLFMSAHSLKSSAANLGAERLSELAKTLEFNGREERLTESAGTLKLLQTCYAETTFALNQLLGSSSESSVAAN
jgi:HPt (histidine-containing phosphotransfer) domain-containing protein